MKIYYVIRNDCKSGNLKTPFIKKEEAIKFAEDEAAKIVNGNTLLYGEITKSSYLYSCGYGTYGAYMGVIEEEIHKHLPV